VGLTKPQILNGEIPSDVPVQQSTKVELIINRKAANALGLTISPALLARADNISVWVSSRLGIDGTNPFYHLHVIGARSPHAVPR